SRRHRPPVSDAPVDNGVLESDMCIFPRQNTDQLFPQPPLVRTHMSLPRCASVASIWLRRAGARLVDSSPAIEYLMARSADGQLQVSLTPGTRVAQYEVQALIGAGGMGEVYRAHDARLG